MNWSSVKNLLIAILIAANLFMLFNIARQDRTRNYMDEGEVAAAVELLAERGLIVPISCVPLRKFKAPIYESFYSDAYHNSLAEAMTMMDVPLYLQPDNSLSGISDDGVYVSYDQEFGFVYNKNDKIDTSAYTDVTEENFKIMAQAGSELTASQKKKLIREADAFLSLRAEDDDALAVSVTESYHDPVSGYSYLLAYQTFDEYPVFSHWAVLVFDEEELAAAHGRWYFASVDNSYVAELQNQVNILFTDLETLSGELNDPFSAALASDDEPAMPSQNLTANSSLLNTAGSLPQVISMSNGYVIYWNSDKTALYFIPAWQIAHIGGNTIVYNAANGTVYSRN
ncbi:MAG: hypothetical protein E7632_08675 [Ruminococcaceae bacterium]|nr:hypothetical protein [Oscillospiraceae bacterium]